MTRRWISYRATVERLIEAKLIQSDFDLGADDRGTIYVGSDGIDKTARGYDVQQINRVIGWHQSERKCA